MYTHTTLTLFYSYTYTHIDFDARHGHEWQHERMYECASTVLPSQLVRAALTGTSKPLAAALYRQQAYTTRWLFNITDKGHGKVHSSEFVVHVDEH
jgi:DNA topoisomerase IB